MAMPLDMHTKDGPVSAAAASAAAAAAAVASVARARKSAYSKRWRQVWEV